MQTNQLKRYRRRRIFTLCKLNPVILDLHRVKKLESESISNHCLGLFIPKSMKLDDGYMAEVPLPCDQKRHCEVNRDLNAITIINSGATGWQERQVFMRSWLVWILAIIPPIRSHINNPP